MAKFIRLTEKRSGDPIFLNMDLIEYMSSCDNETQLFALNSDAYPYRVRETPEEIMKMMEE